MSFTANGTTLLRKLVNQALEREIIESDDIGSEMIQGIEEEELIRTCILDQHSGPRNLAISHFV